MDRLNIAFIADKNFYLPSVVTLTSLFESCKKKSAYVIYYIAVDLTHSQKECIRELCRKSKSTVKIIEIDKGELQGRYSRFLKHDGCATISALIKFDLPYLCNDIDTVLYLDGDMIVKKDLSELAQIRLEDEYLAAVKDSGLLYSKTLISQEIESYFNSGLMLLNLKKMRIDAIPEALAEEKFKSTDNSLMDQHVLNKVFEDHVKFLGHEYNLLYVNLIRARYFYGLELKDINKMYGKDYCDWDDMLNQACIIHYSSFDKPWKYSDVSAVKIWDYYYQKSPFKNKKLHRKKLHISMLNKMRESNKLMALAANFIWECETKGFWNALKDVYKYLIRKN